MNNKYYATSGVLRELKNKGIAQILSPQSFLGRARECPLNLIDLKKMRNRGLFDLAIIEKPKSKLWYKKQRMGVNSIDFFMKNMALEAELDEERRRLTSHSVRKTLVKKLKASNQPRSAIIVVTGHTLSMFKCIPATRLITQYSDLHSLIYNNACKMICSFVEINPRLYFTCIRSITALCKFLFRCSQGFYIARG